MKKQQQSGKPFFANFLEHQLGKDTERNLQGGEDTPPNITHKYPSDAEDTHTKKFPTDSDEITLAYPSDSDHDGPYEES